MSHNGESDLMVLGDGVGVVVVLMMMVIGFCRFFFPPPTRITYHLKGIFCPTVSVLVWVNHEFDTTFNSELSWALTDLIKDGT